MPEITDEELEQLKTAAARVPELEGQLTSLQESHGTERTALLGHYIEALAQANPLIPKSAISGDSVESINASLGTAVELAKNIQTALANQPKQQIGFQPPNSQGQRTQADVSSMSPLEKIKWGLDNK